MDIGIIGLGRMGLSLAARARQRGNRVVGWDPDGEARTSAEADARIETIGTLPELVAGLAPPRTLLMYVPHGAPVDANLDELLPLLEHGDVVADGGNSHWEDSKQRYDRCADQGVGYLDIGTSGGTSAAYGWRGAAFMVGGAAEAFSQIEPLLLDLAVDEEAVLHVGPAGAGHFVKLVHNGIEFGMLQSIAEGLELLTVSGYDLDLAQLFEHYNHGTVIRSWLTELMANALRNEEAWETLDTRVEDTGEVKWILQWAMDHDVPTPAIAAAQTVLMQSRDVDSAAARALALLRHEFGGHPVLRRPAGGTDASGHE